MIKKFDLKDYICQSPLVKEQEEYTRNWTSWIHYL